MAGLTSPWTAETLRPRRGKEIGGARRKTTNATATISATDILAVYLANSFSLCIAQEFVGRRHKIDLFPEMRMIIIGARLVRRGKKLRDCSMLAKLTKKRNNARKIMTDSLNYVELAAEIVSAYVSNNSVPSSDLPTLLSDVHAAIVRVSTGVAVAAPEAAKPAVAPKKSITNEHIICLEDGRKFKSLKRHLRTQYNLSPDEYREKWSLPPDYPMVAPAYAKARSALAKQMGLGQQRRRRAK